MLLPEHLIWGFFTHLGSSDWACADWAELEGRSSPTTSEGLSSSTLDVTMVTTLVGTIGLTDTVVTSDVVDVIAEETGVEGNG